MEGKGQRVFVCVFICVYVCGEHGDREEVGGCSPAPKRFVSAKRFPCPSQMAGHAPTLIGGERRAKGTQRQKTHLFVCSTNKLLLWSMYRLDSLYTECNLYSITDKKKRKHHQIYVGSGERSYWSKQNPTTLLKEWSILAPRVKIDRIRETGKESWTKSEDNGKRGWG